MTNRLCKFNEKWIWEVEKARQVKMVFRKFCHQNLSKSALKRCAKGKTMKAAYSRKASNLL